MKTTTIFRYFFMACFFFSSGLYIGSYNKFSPDEIDLKMDPAIKHIGVAMGPMSTDDGMRFRIEVKSMEEMDKLRDGVGL